MLAINKYIMYVYIMYNIASYILSKNCKNNKNHSK